MLAKTTNYYYVSHLAMSFTYDIFFNVCSYYSRSWYYYNPYFTDEDVRVKEVKLAQPVQGRTSSLLFPGLSNNLVGSAGSVLKQAYFTSEKIEGL